MASTATAPKIVGKAFYLELVADPTQDEDEVRRLLGWQHKGTKQIILFPEYQDDTGKVWGSVMLQRLITKDSPRAQWDFTFIDRYRVKESTPTTDSYYVDFPNYSNAEWDTLTQKEKFDSRKRGLSISLGNQIISAGHSRDAEGNAIAYAKQVWVVRDNKPISVELTDEDLSDLHMKQKTPQAVIRRINKVRESLDKFPEKLA